MNKYKVKQLFWKIVNEVENCSDIVIKNNEGLITEKGAQLSNGYSVMFGLEDGVLRVYNNQLFPLIAFTEESEVLLVMQELFETFEII